MVLGFLTKREQLQHGECLVATKIYGMLTKANLAKEEIPAVGIGTNLHILASLMGTYYR